MPLIAGVLLVAWTVFFLLAGAGADVLDDGAIGWITLLAAWSVPVLLVLAVWLLVLRYAGADASSRLDTSETDHALAEKVNRIAALQEKTIASLAVLEGGSADLDKLAEGRLEHLRLQSERFKVEMETREQDNLSAIRRRADELSKALSKEDIAMRGRTSQAMDEMQARFKAVREESLRLSGELEKVQADALKGWDRAVADLEARMTETVGKVVAVDQSAVENTRKRLAALHAEAEKIDVAAAQRLAAFETDAAERLTAFEAEIARRGAEAEKTGGAALGALETQLDDFDRRLDERRQAQLTRLADLGDRSEALAARLAEVDGQLAGHVEQSEAASHALGSFAGDLSARLAESRELLANSDKAVGDMIGASERMFEMIRVSADYSAKTIPAALDEAGAKIGQFEERTTALRDSIVEAERKGAALNKHLAKAREGVPVSSEALDALGQRLEDLAAKADMLSHRTRKELGEAISELENSSTRMADTLRAGQQAALTAFAADFGERSLEVVGKGLREKTEAAIAELDAAAGDAGKAGLETIEQVKGELASLREMAGHLEARVADAREKAQEEPNKDFSIEMTKISEKLNSAAIDITKIFDADVPDTAWHAYMRGDYGVFTRKAVRLLSSQKADAVYGYYKSDETFRETVNRYVRDFESMLKVVLATRNGHQMAVTLLSSDIGKLYVALAQATERLRT